MKTDRKSRFALLIVVITPVLVGATVSTTTGTFVDQEVVTVDKIETDIDGNESATTDNGTQLNETSDGEMTADETRDAITTDTSDRSAEETVTDG